MTRALTPRVVGLSAKARHGKDTVGGFIRETLSPLGVEVRIVGFADAVKAEARSLGWNGEKDDAGRSALQRLGAGRRVGNPNYWIDKLFEQVNRPDAQRVVWVVVDVRYRNEADRIRAEGGVVWRIERWNGALPFANDLTPEQRLHSSEVDLDNYPNFDAYVLNGRLDVTKKLVVAELARAGWVPT